MPKWVNPMDPKTLFDLKNSVEALCVDVSAFIRAQLNAVRQDDVETKDMNSLVSYVDKEAEKMIVAHLSKLLPEAGFITEENTVSQEVKSKMWIIDPLDGTTNFLYKIPHFSISIALRSEEETLLGVVYEIPSDTSFSAIKGQGAWENNKAISVNSSRPKSELLVVTGFPYDREASVDARLEILKFCILNYRGIRRLGSAALDLAYVASGRFDIYYENTLNIWDIAAGALIVEEAGGVISDYQGNQEHLKNGSIIATYAQHHQEILNVIQEHLS